MSIFTKSVVCSILFTQVSQICCGDDNAANKLPNTRIEQAYLSYVDAMAQQQKEWNSWCEQKPGKTNGLKAFHQASLTKHRHARKTAKNLAKESLGKEFSFRQDIKSPYYKQRVSTNNDAHDAVASLINILENEAYHDELKFLQTQQHKIELYWSTKPRNLQEMQNEEYKKRRDLLSTEIMDAFNSTKGRNTFTYPTARVS